jgi:hypothetical protein
MSEYRNIFLSRKTLDKIELSYFLYGSVFGVIMSALILYILR